VIRERGKEGESARGGEGEREGRREGRREGGREGGRMDRPREAIAQRPALFRCQSRATKGCEERTRELRRERVPGEEGEEEEEEEGKEKGDEGEEEEEERLTG